jgi:8-oxo-dGTP pyrophosphatase MutT (NUDIX family)
MQGIAASSLRNGADAPMRAPRPAAVIFQDEYVLLHQVESDDFWCLPGGRVEPGEHAAQTVIREMQEEVGAYVHIEKTFCTRAAMAET